MGFLNLTHYLRASWSVLKATTGCAFSELIVDIHLSVWYIHKDYPMEITFWIFGRGNIGCIGSMSRNNMQNSPNFDLLRAFPASTDSESRVRKLDPWKSFENGMGSGAICSHTTIAYSMLRKALTLKCKFTG